MIRIEKVIPDDLLESTRIYLRAAAETGAGFASDINGYGKASANEDPIMVMVHHRLLPVAEMLYRTPLRRSYCYTVVYDDKSLLPKHTDRLAASYNLDVCFHDSAPETPWKLYIEGEGYTIRPGEGIAFFGNQQEHWREGTPKPGQEVIMTMFHFIDKNAAVDGFGHPFSSDIRDALLKL